jgi:hypothetical protein
MSLAMLVAMPLLYMVFGFLFTLLGAWIYNLVASRVGGIRIHDGRDQCDRASLSARRNMRAGAMRPGFYFHNHKYRLHCRQCN